MRPVQLPGKIPAAGQPQSGPRPVQDNDGTCYLLSEDRNNGLRIYRLSADYLSVDSAVAVLGSSGSVESPAMIKKDGTYYVLGSHLTGWRWSLSDNIYATATSLTGPWSAFRDFAAPAPVPTAARRRTSSRSRAAPETPTSTPSTAATPPTWAPRS
ncbi:hypothetical protein KCMC57_up56930 [Kitasatospora sp. CMC57]|uniref:Uncharacterized protein n=1 Tax=Kitasatospora sp. CMC57 TaxID=3231513 RepID=A0AB33KA27_9ACTN